MFKKVRAAPQGWDIVEPPEQGLLPQPDQTAISSTCELTHGNLKLKVRSKSERVVGPLYSLPLAVLNLWFAFKKTQFKSLKL